MTNARELKAVKQQSNFGGGAGPNLHSLFCGRRNQSQEAVDASLAALDSRLGGECVDQARLQIAGIAEVYWRELFASLVEGEELKVSGRVVEPRDTLRGGAPCPGGNDDLEAAEVPTPVAVFAAVDRAIECRG